MAVVGPDIGFACFPGGDEVDRVGSAEKEIGRSGKHQRAGSFEQAFGNGNEGPESVVDVFGEAGGNLTHARAGSGLFAQVAMEHGVKFGKRPERRIDNVGIANEIPYLGGLGFI